MISFIILLLFILFSLILCFKFSLFSSCIFKEHPFGTFCMYSKPLEKQELLVSVLIANESIDITEEAVAYLSYNFAEGDFTSFSHSHVIPKRFIISFGLFLLENNIHPLLKSESATLNIQYSHLVSGSTESFQINL